jgi:hypothetical protein
MQSTTVATCCREVQQLPVAGTAHIVCFETRIGLVIWYNLALLLSFVKKYGGKGALASLLLHVRLFWLELSYKVSPSKWSFLMKTSFPPLLKY